MKIRTRATLLGLLPAMLLGMALVTYFSIERFHDLETNLTGKGLALARYVALGARYGVVSGNVASIQPMLDHALKEPDVVHVAVYRPDGHLVTEAGQAPEGLALPFAKANLDSVEFMAFRVPVEIDTPALDYYFPEAEEPPRVVAWVQIALSRQGYLDSARTMVLNTALMGLIAVLLVVLLVQWLAVRGLKPLMQIIDAVGRIGDGDFMTRLPLTARSELRLLQSGINRMSEKLAGVERDLRERVRIATLELARQKENAEQANAAKGKFLASASHDLRQPLHAVVLFVVALKQRCKHTQEAELVERIEASINGLSEMLNTLLDLSRLETGNLRPESRHFPLQGLLQRLDREFGHLAEAKGLWLKVRPSPAVLESDPMLLHQVLGNLVSNALRYTECGGVLIGARARGDQVRIQVWDTGIGIALEDQPHIFDEYFQAANPARNRDKGLGLGLNIAQRLCQLLGHRLEVDSVLGRGSVFSLEVPRGKPERLAELHSPAPAWGDFQGQSVLVLDDDGTVLEAVSALLISWGLRPIVSETLEAALAALARGERPDLIVSDYRLEGEADGLQAIDALRAGLVPPPPAILISGDTAAESVARMEATGLPVLYKPVRPAKLRVVLRDLLEAGRDRPSHSR